MNFMTTEYVAEQAKLGELPALEMSLKHHEQGRDADWVELKDAIKGSEFALDSVLCASCLFANSECGKCCLATGDKQYAFKACCDGVWYEANCALSRLEDDYSNANFKAFQEAEAKVCTYIEAVLERKKAEQKDVNCSTCEYQKIKGCDHPCSSCFRGIGGYTKHKPRDQSKKESKPALRHGDECTACGLDGYYVGGLVRQFFTIVPKKKRCKTCNKIYATT